MTDCQENRKRPIRLCIIINPSIGLYNFYRKQYSYLIENGFEITGISGPGPEHDIVRKMGVKTHVVSMERLPRLAKDLLGLIRLWWYLLWHRFDIVHVSTPKASFLGALAAFFSGHRRVVYTLRGRPYENMTGVKRKIMNVCERTTCGIAKYVIPNCRELGGLMVKEGLCKQKKIYLIGSGSGNGVDIERFRLTNTIKEMGKDIRGQLNIAGDDINILFVGWIRKEKGINELIKSFVTLAGKYHKAHLTLVGKYWEGDPIEPQVQNEIENHPQIHYLPWRREIGALYASADINVLPSYREGFPNVVLEAAASSLPTITTDVIGCREAVINEQTGLIVPLGDVDALEKALETLVEDKQLCQKFGAAAFGRAAKEFKQEIVWEQLVSLYSRLLCR